MKNLKKALSLVLASAMLIGMMVVGTGAAHSDVKAEHNEEAIAVVTAAGIMGAGDTFNPNGEITRGEMAVIMTNMLDLDTKEFKGAANFTDAGWAADYIDACYANGIMAGVSATEFGTNMKVTTAQAALMMLKALGYFEYRVINDWMLDTIKLAAKIDLLEGIDAKASAVMTRNEVAQLAFNALMTETVEESTNGAATSIKGEGFEISIGASVDETFGETLMVELFDDRFESYDSTDAYGRPSIEWYDNKNDEVIINIGEAADYVLVAEKDVTLKKLIKDNKLDKKIETEDETAIAAGEVVELWIDDDKAIETVVVYNYAIAQITEIEEVDEDLEEDEVEAGAKYWVTIDGIGTVLDIQIDGFDAKTFVEDAYVVFPAIDAVETEFTDDLTADKYIDVEIADSFVGKVTATADDYIRVDGEKTLINAMEGEIEVKGEYTFYKDVNGIILLAVEVEEEEESVKIDEVLYLINIYEGPTSYDKYNNATTKTYAQVMNLEGEVEDLIIAIGDDYGTADYEIGGLYTAKEYTAKKVIDEINYKGTNKLTEWADEDYAIVDVAGEEFEDDSKKVADVRINNKIVFILVEGVEDEIEVAVKTGKQNITMTDDAFIIAEIDKDDNMIAAYVIVPDGEVSKKTEYKDVIYVDADADFENVVVEVEDDDVDCVVFEAYTEAGKAIELTMTEMPEESGFYTYSIEDGIFELEAVEAYDADEETGIVVGEYEGKYGTLATIDGVEVETEGATWIDLHDDDEGYPKSIKNLTALNKAVENDYAVELTVFVKDDAAVVIVVK